MGQFSVEDFLTDYTYGLYKNGLLDMAEQTSQRILYAGKVLTVKLARGVIQSVEDSRAHKTLYSVKGV